MVKQGGEGAVVRRVGRYAEEEEGRAVVEEGRNEGGGLRRWCMLVGSYTEDEMEKKGLKE